MCARSWTRCFHPLVLTTTRGLGREATTFYKHLADIISSKQQKHYTVMCWLRCNSHSPFYNLPSCALGAAHHPTITQDVRSTSPLPPPRVSSVNRIIHSNFLSLFSISFVLPEPLYSCHYKAFAYSGKKKNTHLAWKVQNTNIKCTIKTKWGWHVSFCAYPL